MIGRVRAVYDETHACFTPDGKSITLPPQLDDMLKDGYIELLGEVNPLTVEEVYHLTGPKKEGEGSEASGQVAPVIYEYFWSLGIGGPTPKWYDQLDDHDPIVVQLIFHTQNSKYSPQDIAANLKQVPPFQKTLETKIQDWFEQFKPVVETAGKVLSIGGVSLAGEVLSAISEMKLNTVPVDQFPWWVKTFSTVDEAGIEWHIPKKLVQYVGNRIVGSLGVYFIKCCDKAELKDEFSIEMRAYVRSKSQVEVFISPTDKRTELVISPKPKKRAK
ncbi:MAG: hypothetical protein ACE14S_10720 [Candidatus Bathyarchaeia archaeon]